MQLIIFIAAGPGLQTLKPVHLRVVAVLFYHIPLGPKNFFFCFLVFFFVFVLCLGGGAHLDGCMHQARIMIADISRCKRDNKEEAPRPTQAGRIMVKLLCCSPFRFFLELRN